MLHEFIFQIKNDFYLQRSPPQFQLVCGAVSTGSKNNYLIIDVLQNIINNETIYISMIITVKLNHFKTNNLHKMYLVSFSFSPKLYTCRKIFFNRGDLLYCICYTVFHTNNTGNS